MGRLTALDRLAAYDRQRGRCAACDRHLDGQGAALHHRRLRSQGGDDSAANLVLLHDACHRWVHAHPHAAVEAGLLVPSWADPVAVPLRGVRVGLQPA